MMPRARARFVQLYTGYRPVDWFRVLADLKKNGWSLCEVSRYLDVGNSTVTAWYNGDSEPRHKNGDMLISLWRVVIDPTAEPPRVF